MINHILGQFLIMASLFKIKKKLEVLTHIVSLIMILHDNVKL